MLRDFAPIELDFWLISNMVIYALGKEKNYPRILSRDWH